MCLPATAAQRFERRTGEREGGSIVDYAADKRPIGIELTFPHHTSLTVINKVLGEIDEPATSAELAPLSAVA